MTDRELLELAAKAEGRTLKYMTQHIEGREPEEFIACWNPLTDDGDALRLAVKLHMTGIDCYFWYDAERQSPASAGLGTAAWGGVRVYEPASYGAAIREQDPCAATRRAIVRAAAEIGKAAQ